MYFAHGGGWNELQNASGPFSGSFSGSFQGDGTNLTGVASPTGSYTGSFTGSVLGNVLGTASIADLATTSSFTAGTASIANTATTASHTAGTASIANDATTASFAETGDGTFSGSFSGSFQGDGSSLTGVDAGISTIYNNEVRYVAHTESGGETNGSVEMLSSATLYGGLNWTRSSTTLSITSTAHGLSNGDYVVIQNMSEDYLYASASNVATNTFDITGVTNSGNTSGAKGAYVPAFKASSFTQGGVTISSPSVGDAQIISTKVTTPTKNNTTFDFTMPTSRTNGAGANGTLYNQNPPIIQAWALNNGNQNTSAVITLNTSTNFNVFQVGGLASLVKSMIKVTF